MKDKQSLLLELLQNHEYWRVPTMAFIKEKIGYYDKKSVIVGLRSLQKRGLINEKYKPIYHPLELNTSGTTYCPSNPPQ